MRKKTLDLIDKAFAACFIEPTGDPNRSNCITAAYLLRVLTGEGVSVPKKWIKYLKKENPGNHDFIKEIEEREKNA